MTVGVGFLDPLPGVAEPVVALFLRHEGEPRDFVPAPNERGLARLAGIASAEVIELHQVRQVLARPTAGRDATLALVEDGIGITNLEDSFVRLIGDLDNPQWEGME